MLARSTAVCLGLALTLTGSAGCAGDPPITTIPDVSAERRWVAIPPSAWARVEVEPHRGYVEHEYRQHPEGLVETYWVYDENMEILGFYTGGGTTFRYDVRDRPVALGRHDPDESVRIIFDPASVGLKTEVRHLPLEGGRPR
ncbi:MAG: hypothetical protein HY722_12025 [Planctomycetes bacterium]|nr:hypothetical protein [Planctomycetota bacterium]